MVIDTNKVDYGVMHHNGAGEPHLLCQICDSAKYAMDDGAIVEIVVWALPAPVPGSSHRFKYRLFYGRPGERIVGYDMNAARAITSMSAAGKRRTGSRPGKG